MFLLVKKTLFKLERLKNSMRFLGFEKSRGNKINIFSCCGESLVICKGLSLGVPI